MPARRRNTGTTTERGYGSTHQKERARLAPTVKAGHAQCAEYVCLMPTRWIRPGTPWDLAHDRVTGQWLGPAHRRCNRAEAARYKNALKRVAIVKHWASRNW